MKRVHFLNIFFSLIKEASLSGSGFVYCWPQHFSGSVWSNDILQGVIQITHVVVKVETEKDISWFVRRKNYTGDGRHRVLQKGSAGCQYIDLKA